MAIRGKITSCSGSSCKFCYRGSLDASTEFKSCCSNKVFNIEFDVTCKTGCCIYLITCKICYMKYVGKSKNSIRERFNGHRGHMVGGTESFIMFNHFMGINGHGINNMIIKPIELCAHKDLADREKYWMAELNTVFPYGLNDRAYFSGIKDAYSFITSNNSTKAIYSIFNKVESRRSNRSKKIKDNINPDNLLNTNFNQRLFIEEICNSTNHTNFCYFARTNIMKLTKEEVKLVFLEAVQLLQHNGVYSCANHEYPIYVIKDICLYRLKIHHLQIKKQEKYIVVHFVNKLVENIKCDQIISRQDISSLFPIKDKKLSCPKISYSYSKPIRNKILNYKETICDPNPEKFTCACLEYPSNYVDNHHKHIFTGDLGIIKNKELRTLMEKGLGYHDQQAPNKDKAHISFVSGIDTYIDKTSRQYSIPISKFTPWKTELLKIISDKLEKSNSYKYNNVISNKNVKKALEDVHKDFVIVQVDKASKNMVLVCKKFYMDILTNEIEYSATFQQSAISEADLLNVISDGQKLFHKVINVKRKIPLLYWTAKMHKTPVSSRFITAGNDTILSELSSNVSKCLSKLMKTAYNNDKYHIKEIDNTIYIIDNRSKVIKFLDKSNFSNEKKKCMSTWDFSNLYTNIPHNKLKENIKFFINKIFSCIDKEYITCSPKSKTAYYSKSKSIHNASFGKDSLIKSIEFIIDNSYITFHGKIYRQIIGIPMGTNCAPYLANLFLHVFEYKYLSLLITNGKIEMAKKLSNVFRYQDDCLAANDDGLFAQHFTNIYPPELKLNNTNTSINKSNFLDMTISIYRGNFTYRSYDKRDGFKFQICNYPHLEGNIPTGPSYGVYTSQLVRLAEINKNIAHYKSDIRNMTNKFVLQGFVLSRLKDTFMKFCTHYIDKWAKFGIIMPSGVITNSIL